MNIYKYIHIYIYLYIYTRARAHTHTPRYRQIVRGQRPLKIPRDNLNDGCAAVPHPPAHFPGALTVFWAGVLVWPRDWQ